MKFVGGLIAGWFALVGIGQLIAEGVLPVGAIAQVFTLRFLNGSDALRGKPTGGVEVNDVPDFSGCELNEDGSANCNFED